MILTGNVRHKSIIHRKGIETIRRLPVIGTCVLHISLEHVSCRSVSGNILRIGYRRFIGGSITFAFRKNSIGGIALTIIGTYPPLVLKAFTITAAGQGACADSCWCGTFAK